MSPFSLIYLGTCLLFLGGACFWLERRSEAGRRHERLQQVICTVHFLAVIGWIERERLGFASPAGKEPTVAGLVLEILAVGTALALAVASIVYNPGVNWKRFFTVFGAAAILHAGIFGGAAILWSKALGFQPSLETVIEEKNNFGKEPEQSKTDDKETAEG